MRNKPLANQLMPSQPCHDRKWPFNVPQIASPFDAKGAVISCK